MEERDRKEERQNENRKRGERKVGFQAHRMDHKGTDMSTELRC